MAINDFSFSVENIQCNLFTHYCIDISSALCCVASCQFIVTFPVSQCPQVRATHHASPVPVPDDSGKRARGRFDALYAGTYDMNCHRHCPMSSSLSEQARWFSIVIIAFLCICIWHNYATYDGDGDGVCKAGPGIVEQGSLRQAGMVRCVSYSILYLYSHLCRCLYHSLLPYPKT